MRRYGYRIRCDHRDDEQVRAVFDRIQSEQTRPDVPGNNIWGSYEHLNDWPEPLVAE
jgi:hypothetical protein